MNQHSEQNEIITKFAKVKKRQMLALIPVALTFLLFFLSSQNPELIIFNIPSSAFPPIGFAIVVSVVIFSLFNWHCPACDAYLGKGMGPKFCPKCGVKLEE